MEPSLTMTAISQGILQLPDFSPEPVQPVIEPEKAEQIEAHQQAQQAAGTEGQQDNQPRIGRRCRQEHQVE